MRVSNRLLLRNENRASTHAVKIPGGRINKAARKAVRMLNHTTCQSDISLPLYGKKKAFRLG
jgi:hypothetical protein